MDTNLNVAIAPKDSTFQVRINSEIKRAVEDIYAKTGMTLTDAIRGLCDYEEKGPEVSKKFDVVSDYRYIFVSRNYVFYRIEDKYIRKINLYHEKEDIIKKSVFMISSCTI